MMMMRRRRGGARVIKSTKKRLEGQVAHMEAMRNAYKILVGNLMGRSHSEDLDVDERILEWTLS
jgi:hypothetical protein